jgi:hypothetical protein
MLFHKYKIWFIGIPKTGTTSIHHLWRNLTDRDHDHYRVYETYESHDRELLDSYYQFTIVRNPYDRIASACFQHMRDENGCPIKDVNEMIAHLKGMSEDGLIQFNESTTPAYLYLLDKPKEQGGEVSVKKMWKFENLQQEYEAFAEQYNQTSAIKMPAELSMHKNKSVGRKEWFEILNRESIKTINKLYAKDFAAMGYKMLNPEKYTRAELVELDD